MNILILSPHTDDCELGCGGSLTKWLAEGHNVFVVVFSLCKKSIPSEFKYDATYKEFIENMGFLGCGYNSDILALDALRYEDHYPVRQFHAYRQDILEDMIIYRNEYKPDLVIGTSLNDIHQDHKVIAEEMQRAFRCSLLSYELPYTSLNFKPIYYVPLERKHIENKIKLLENYKSQIAKGKAVWTPEYQFGLAKVRGTQINKEYAESFEVLRWIENSSV